MPYCTNLFEIVASANFTGVGGVGVWVSTQHHGFAAAFVRNAAGDYTFTLDEPAPPAEAIIIANNMTAIATNSEPCITYVRPSDTTVRITTGLNTANGGAGGTALTDHAFAITVLKTLRP